jgi:NitT/TauT family transport system permease protein
MSSALRSHRVPIRWVRGAIGAVVLLVGLEALTRAELVTPDYLPPASSILRETFDLLTEAEFRNDLWVTVQACVIGLVLATIVAVPLGIVLGLGRTAYKASIVVIEFLRPIPSVALIPLAILIYGRGTEMKVALVIFACLWPILFNTIYGMRSVDPVAADTARVFGLGRFQIGARVYLRSASPFIFTGFKIAASIAVILAVSAELLAGGSEGIGIVMLEAASVGNQRTVYAITIVTGLLGLALLAVLGFIERRLFAWADVEGARS